MVLNGDVVSTGDIVNAGEIRFDNQTAQDAAEPFCCKRRLPGNVP